MGCSLQPGNIRVGFLEEVIPELNIKRCTGGRQIKAVSLINTVSSDHEHSGLKDYWWVGEGGEMKKEIPVVKMMAFVLDFGR